MARYMIACIACHTKTTVVDSSIRKVDQVENGRPIRSEELAAHALCRLCTKELIWATMKAQEITFEEAKLIVEPLPDVIQLRRDQEAAKREARDEREAKRLQAEFAECQRHRKIQKMVFPDGKRGAAPVGQGLGRFRRKLSAV